MLIPIRDPPHPRLGHPFHILRESRAGTPCGSPDVLGAEGMADLPLVNSPVNIIVTHVELGTTPAPPSLPFSLQSAERSA